MQIETFSTCRLVMGADLNHHGTLFAGRAAEWFVEAGFIAASSITSPESIVCAKLHGMVFTRPVKSGSLIRCEGKIIHAGRTSLVAYVKIVLHPSSEFVVDGFLTFVHVDSNGKSTPHGITIKAVTQEDLDLQAKVQTLQ